MTRRSTTRGVWCRRLVVAALVAIATTPAGSLPPNDGCLTATVVDGVPFTGPLSFQFGTSSPFDPPFCLGLPADLFDTAWFRTSDQLSGKLCLALSPARDAEIDVLQGDCGTLFPLPPPPGCFGPRVVEATAGVPLLIRVPDAFGAAGSQLSITDGSADSDGDGNPDCTDRCPQIPDGLDSDGDGVPDCDDVCPLAPRDAGSACSCYQVTHLGCPDPPGCGVDGDFDGVPDACDNCPFVPNADQADQNADGIGDACTGLATIYTRASTIHSPSPSAGDQFGTALATTSPGNGALLLVGAPFVDVGGFDIDAGAAYLFDASDALVTAVSTSNPGDHAGAALAFRGNTPLVGAPFNDAAAVDGGAVFAFTSGALVPLDVPTPPSGAQVGFAIAADEVVVAGAPGDSSDAEGAGRVVVTSIAPGGGTATSHGPSDAAAGAQLGVAVAALGNQTFAVGATFARAGDVAGAGAVYLFDAAAGTFAAPLHAPSPKPGDMFGFAIATVAGNLLVAAPFDDTGGQDAGAVYVLGRDGTQRGVLTSPTPAPGDHFGAAIVSLDRFLTASGYAAVSAPEANVLGHAAGVVYVIDADPARGTFGQVVQTLRNPTPDDGDRFGLALAAADPPVGNSASLPDILVGAPRDDADGTDAGLVYRFRFCGTFCPANCGDGVLEDGEECDDGNFIDGDGCDGNCTRTRCGNGIITAGEACDDGNNDPGDGCSPNCEACGVSLVAAAPAVSTDAAVACVDFCACSVDNGKCCDDGDPCTVNDTCLNGVCRGSPVDCDDGIACTVDRCVPGGQSPNCVHTPEDSLCDDQAFCTLDVCNPSTGCQNTPIPDCCTTDDDCRNGNACDGDESCIPCIGCEYHVSPCCARGAVCAKGQPPEDGAPCDDHDVCTTADACHDAVCVGSEVDCNGGDPCLTYSCDAPSIGCTSTLVPGCRSCPHGDADCVDDNACNGRETCTDGRCAAGTALDCDDGDPCTDDRCDRAQGCVSTKTQSATVRCLIQGALHDPACMGQPLSTGMTQRLDTATANVESAQTTTDPKTRKKLVRKAQQSLGRARKQLAGRGSRKVSAACRSLLRQAIADAKRLAAGLK